MEKFSWRLAINPNIVVLKLLGLWPKGHEGYKFNLYTLYSLSMNAFVDGDNFFQTIYIFYIYSDLQALAAIVFLLFTDWLASIKAYYFFRNMNLLKELMVELQSKEFQPNKHQRTLVQPMLKLWTFVYKAYWFSVGTTLLLLALFPIVDGSFRQYRLPFFAWYPFDTTVSPFYEITYFYQMFSICFLAIVCLNVDTLIAALMVFIISQCDILCDNLKNLQTCKKSNYNSKLIVCVEHHQKILRFADKSNQFFNEIALGQFFTSSASLALAMFQLTVVEPWSSECYSLLFYGASMVVEICLYCWFGNEVEMRVSLVFYNNISIHKNL
ncbi:hypothetical protein MTP99_008864 [Tenebrio molitor]|nr:hypothetical protein MTP99_008864 [Tenebrio molitor]